MKILITGATGFLGNVISTHLVQDKKIKVVSLGRTNAQILSDLSIEPPVINFDPDIVIHAAGLAHFIPKTENDKNKIFKTNLVGTLNLLEGLKEISSLRRFVFISSVSVYGIESEENINEGKCLLANDPYGLSKIRSEIAIEKWCTERDILCTILRLPLVVGTNPPGNLGSMIKGIKSGYYINISNNNVKKSMVLASDIAKHIIPASEIGGIFNLTDGYHPDICEISKLIATQLNKNAPLTIPFWFAKIIAKFGDFVGPQFPINSYKLQKLTSSLTFDDSKARRTFGWLPTPVLEGFKI